MKEFQQAGGQASAKKRLAGKTPEEIREYMRRVRAKQNPKTGEEKERKDKEGTTKLRLS